MVTEVFDVISRHWDCIEQWRLEKVPAKTSFQKATYDRPLAVGY